jgi:hypothetical protein
MQRFRIPGSSFAVLLTATLLSVPVSAGSRPADPPPAPQGVEVPEVDWNGETVEEVLAAITAESGTTFPVRVVVIKGDTLNSNLPVSSVASSPARGVAPGDPPAPPAGESIVMTSGQYMHVYVAGSGGPLQDKPALQWAAIAGTGLGIACAISSLFKRKKLA